MPRADERTEELANAFSHGLGGVLALAAWPVLAGPLDQPAPASLQQTGSTVFAITMLLMFVVSSAYHASPVGPGRRRLQRLDHATIYLFIAGSCTPFALGGADHPETWPLLGAVWAMALAGMLLKLADRLRRPFTSTLLYLAFGWMAAAAALPAMAQMPDRSFTLMVAGGLAYTVGAGFYLLGRRMPYGHLVWHLLVMAGCGCHLLAVWPPGG